MSDVLDGFAVVWLIIIVGFALGRLRVLGPDARVVLGRISFFVASPCLLFSTISGSSISSVLGPQFAVAGISAILSLIFFLAGAPFLLRGRSLSEYAVAGHSASQVNAANLGFPIAAYVLGDVALAAPVVVFQLAIYMPFFLVGVLDQLTARERAASNLQQGTFRGPLRRLGQTLVTPIIIGSALGLVFAWQQWQFPQPIRGSVELLAGAAIPVMLLTFGLSLVGNTPLKKAAGRRRDVIMATGTKLVVHPVLAYLVAVHVFGMEGALLYAAVIMASLPTAQNIFITAVRYDAGETIARDTVLLTTVLALPIMVAIFFTLT